MGGDALRVSGDRGVIAREKTAARGAYAIPNLSVSASVKDGVLTVTLANLSVTEAADVRLNLSELTPAAEAEYLTLTASDPHAHNTYEDPEAVKLESRTGSFDGFVTVPAFSAVTVKVRV